MASYDEHGWWNEEWWDWPDPRADDPAWDCRLVARVDFPEYPWNLGTLYGIPVFHYPWRPDWFDLRDSWRSFITRCDRLQWKVVTPPRTWEDRRPDTSVYLRFLAPDGQWAGVHTVISHEAFELSDSRVDLMRITKQNMVEQMVDFLDKNVDPELLRELNLAEMAVNLLADRIDGAERRKRMSKWWTPEEEIPVAIRSWTPPYMGPVGLDRYAQGSCAT